MKHPIDKVVDDARDTLNEAGHKGEADAERERRELASGVMTLVDNAAAALSERKERGEVDKVRREAVTPGTDKPPYSVDQRKHN